jgi:hypothetical protein
MRHLLLAVAAATASYLPASVQAEFLAPDFATLTIETIAAPDWLAGPRDGAYIAMCVTCDGLTLLEVRIVDDDGTGGRVRTGETTAARYTEIGKANAARIGGESAYYGTEPIAFASAVGFRTQARLATGDYSTSYQPWDDGKQLVVKAYGPDQNMVDELAENAYTAAAPLSFR